MVNNINQMLVDSGLSSSWAAVLSYAAVVLLIILSCLLSWLFVKYILARIVSIYFKHGRSKWHDMLQRRNLFSMAANLAPAIIIHMTAPAFPSLKIWIQNLAFSYIVLGILKIITSLMDGFEEVYRTFEISKERPIKGFLQILKIFLYIIGAVIVVSVLLDKSPKALLSGIGVFSAVLLLIFQNTILGFVAGVQLSANDMVRVGDFIEMPKFNADGTVMDITLHTVKVQNGDKSIIMIPTQAMITDSFRNWRGIQEAGARRIKRSVYIDMNSIRFCTEEMLERFEKILYLKDYIRYMRQEVDEYNRQLEADPSQPVNGKRMTNIGTFRIYVQEYLKNHPSINKNMTVMVRQLAPSENGLPVEIYCYTNTTDWSEYEKIQADIFDHIFAVIPQFDLRIFQNPTGKDLEAWTHYERSI